MQWLYTIFEWTWHLNSFGNFMWTVFLIAIFIWSFLGMLFIAGANDPTLGRLIRFFTIWFTSPLIVLLLVGYIGYLSF
jgi:hypothetical protein